MLFMWISQSFENWNLDNSNKKEIQKNKYRPVWLKEVMHFTNFIETEYIYGMFNALEIAYSLK